MHDGAGIPLNRSILGRYGKVCGDRWGQGAIVTYEKSCHVSRELSPSTAKGSHEMRCERPKKCEQPPA